jgi:molybdate transport system substrate-binding protein
MIREDAVRPLLIVSTPALAAVLDAELIPRFEEAHGASVEAAYLTTTALRERIQEGMSPDLVLGMAGALGELVASAVLPQQDLVPLARCGIGVAIAPSLGSPPLSSVDDLIELVLRASSVAYSRSGASGIYFGRLLDELGIAERVNSRATILASGYAAQSVVDGVADVAVQLMPELMLVDGARILGPLPSEVQQELVVVMASAGSASVAQGAFSDLLVSPWADAAYERHGLSLVSHQQG